MLRHFPFPSAFSRTKLLMQAFPNETFGSCDLNLTAFAAAEILLFACSDCLTTDTKQRISLLWDTSHIRKGCDKILRFQRLACDIFPTFWAAKKPYQNGRVFACFLSVIRVGSVIYPIFFRAKKWTCFEVKRSKCLASMQQAHDKYNVYFSVAKRKATKRFYSLGGLAIFLYCFIQITHPAFRSTSHPLHKAMHRTYESYTAFRYAPQRTQEYSWLQCDK